MLLTKNAEEIIKARDALKNAVPELDNWRTRIEAIGITADLIGNSISDTGLMV